MAARRWCITLALALTGCDLLPHNETPKTATVSSNPFGLHAPQRMHKINHAPADEALATRVDSVGRKLLAANPGIGLKNALFATIGNAPQPEVFHTGTNMIYVTDGLVKRCAGEPELAAILAVELGRVVAEREAAATPDMRQPERLPPIQVPIGNAGQGGDWQFARQAELARHEKERPKAGRPLPRPHPEDLARDYLTKAGFQAVALDAARPLLQEAEANVTLERQFKGVVTPASWTP